jgi:hypothetical protein
MTERPKHWPSGVTPVGIEDLDRLGINGRNELFWDGRRMITRSKVYLTFPQTILAVLATIASLATIATGLNNASVFLCARDIHWLGCPAPPPGVTK